MTSQRRSGVLLHPTSLPGRYGIGSFNAQAYRWVDFLSAAGQSIWQVLPLGPTSYGDSPYQSFSSHAGNTHLIGLEPLLEQELLLEEELEDAPEFEPVRADYGTLYEWKRPLLYRVAAAFEDRADKELQSEFAEFCHKQAHWLDDFALFMAIKEAHDNVSWQEWPKGLKRRRKKSLEQFAKKHKSELHTHKVLQFLFRRQWLALRKYANERGVQVLGDLPIFVALDSADAWCNPELFFFDKDLAPTVVAGVPPDYFSEDGQLWGNPLYRWDKMKKNGYTWWLARIRSALDLVDLLRIDHFRGFAGYWEIPAGEETARKGQWVKGPGKHFFTRVAKEFPELPIVAEDLGDITPDVHELRDKFKLPGMLVLQFAFGGDPGNKFLPHNHEQNFVVYTGTHDNDTTRGWFEAAPQGEREFYQAYGGCAEENVVRTMIRLALSSVAHTAIIPYQDVLGLGSEARMNTPSKPCDNWQWRMTEQGFDPGYQHWLSRLTQVCGRLPQ